MQFNKQLLLLWGNVESESVGIQEETKTKRIKYKYSNPAMTEETWKWKGQDLASNAI